MAALSGSVSSSDDEYLSLVVAPSCSRCDRRPACCRLLHLPAGGEHGALQTGSQGGGEEPLGGIDRALFAVALEHFEARPCARLVEVGEADPIGDRLVVNFDHQVGRSVGKSAREGADVGFVVGGSALFGFELPVGDGEFNGDVVESDEDAVTVLGVELFGAIGVGEDGPRPFFAVVEYVGLAVSTPSSSRRRQSRGRPPPPAPPPRWEEGAVGEVGPCLCPSEENGNEEGSVTAVGVLSVFGPHQRQLAWATTGCFLRLEGVPRQWRVGLALSSRWCLGRGLIRAQGSSALVCAGGQLPVWHCFHCFQAIRLVLWLCCDSVTPQKEEPRCLQTYDTDP
eukprot:scaffold20343_cov103-Isochrysis_galbana.AAC.1